MNRRNFILGLGTAATLSGAASVTGAALSNTVEPAANFQIVATDQLTVQRNSDLTGNALEQNGNYSNVSVSDFDHANATPYPNMTVNETTNGDLGMALATNNTADEAYNTNSTPNPYNGTQSSEATSGAIGPLEVVNDGGATKNVGVNYELGADANSGDMTGSDVAKLFTFNIDGTQISPDPSDDSGPDNGGDTTFEQAPSGGTADNTVAVDPGETKTVNLVLNYNDALEEKLSTAASGSSGFGFSKDGTSTADLLDAVIFGDQ